MGMAASVDASSIRGVSDLISAHMSQSTTMDVNLANHISSEADWQDEFSSDVEPSPREATSEEEKAAPSSASESTARNTKGSEREEDFTILRESEEQRDGEDSLGADLTVAKCRGNVVFHSTDIENGDHFHPRSQHRRRSVSLESESGPRVVKWSGRHNEHICREEITVYGTHA
ncbi:hypothetical protein TELCIR_26060, partial [Teladorsagia circumcincta]